jgi:CHAT domain-containing protein
MEVAGEGILGLRRAFHLAGAEVLVTSLWPVEDEATAEWMDAFYSAMWRDGQDPARAARSASLSTRALRQAAGLSAHPAYWAAFVVAR